MDDPSNLWKRKTLTARSGLVLRSNGKCIWDKPSKNHENNCHKCGMKGHWLHTCCTPRHLADLYRPSMKKKGKDIEINFIDGDELDLTCYDIFGGPSK